MLRCLAIVPLLFAAALRADEYDPLREALARRVRQSERVVEATKKQNPEVLFPTALLDAEVELAEARLDAAGNREERIELLKRVIELCGQRMLLAHTAFDAGKTDNYLVERSRLAWLRARLRLLRAVSGESPDGPLDWQQERMRELALDALDAARRFDESSERLWNAGTLGFESRAQAIEDLFRAEMEVAEHDSERLAAHARRSVRCDDFALSARLKLESRISSGPCIDCYEAKDAALRARIALILQMRDPTDEATWRELELYRAARLERLSTYLRILQAAIERREMTISYLDRLLTLSLNCPTDLWTPTERRLVFEQTAWVLDLVEKALRDPGREERADFLELDFAWFERLRTKVEIWDLRRSAQEPPPPQLFPGE